MELRTPETGWPCDGPIHPRWFNPAFDRMIRKHRNAKGQHNRDTFGTWLAQQMKENGLTPWSMAHKVGKPSFRTQLHEYIKDAYLPRPMYLPLIAQGLDIDESVVVKAWRSYR